MSKPPSSLRIPLFSSPFCAEYWRCAAAELRDLRKLLVAALLLALEIVLGGFFIPVGPNLLIYFTFFVKALGAMIYGPIVAVLAALVGDNLGFLLHPNGPYFPGYTLSAVLSALLYALFFYRARVGPCRVVLAKLLVNLPVNVALGCVWSAMLYGKGYLYYFVNSIVKNVALLPLEALLLFAFFGGMAPILVRARLVLATLSSDEFKKDIK